MGNLKFSIKALYSNQTLLDERKGKPWWLALIFFILSLVIIAIPGVVSGYSTNGSSLLKASNNQIEVGLSLFAQQQPGCHIDGDEPVLVCDSSVTASDFNDPQPMKVNDKSLSFTAEYVNSENKTEIITYLNVYYFPNFDPLRNSEDNSKLSDLVSTKILVKDEKEGTYKVPPVSMMILTKSSIQIYAFQTIGATVSSTQTALLEGTFQKLKGTDLSKMYNNGDNFEIWCDFLDKAYDPIKVTKTWLSVGVTTAISAVVILIVGVILFLMTRSKMNPYRDLSFLDAIKMAAFMGLSPAAISLIISFLIPQFGSISFLLIIGLRAMFLAMKSSSVGGPRNDSKPVYQARS